ncbi:unnamed protein product [Cuscuta campestris]|uniref:Peptidase S1 domain-containing protein n=1 Tax=Cuscuta campestris TaxID=132261 RepID=A0A484K7V1_9ASTE|nr:unnamed protein product [Cuscuta campestris]
MPKGSTTIPESSDLLYLAKASVFVLKISGHFKKKKKAIYASGFSIGVDGVLMTCARVLTNIKSLKIEVRSLDEEGFNRTAKLVLLSTEWDLALLEVDRINSSASMTLAMDGSISEGEALFHIGHPHNFIGSFLTGRAAYSCVESVILPSDSCTCAKYACDPLDSTPRYRIMCHIWNDEVFAQFHGKEFQFEKNLHPHVPIIKCAGLSCEDGCLGGPVFNDRGKIVGMMVAQVHGYQISIHVTLLRFFVQRYIEQQNACSSSLDVKRKEPMEELVPKKKTL